VRNAEFAIWYEWHEKEEIETSKQEKTARKEGSEEAMVGKSLVAGTGWEEKTSWAKRKSGEGERSVTSSKFEKVLVLRRGIPGF
jgi:hypothetical protein